MNWRKLLIENWNIGFCNITPEKLVYSKSIGEIQWMKHPYKDRFFADPFIYKVDDHRIIVWVEEVIFTKHKGTIVELHVDRETKQLLNRYELLELKTHLSYPVYFQRDEKTFVYPENSESGHLNVYIYDSNNHSLSLYDKIIEEPLADATILYVKSLNAYLMVATKTPNTSKDLFLYKSDEIWGPYSKVNCVKSSLAGSRQAGGFFEVGKRVFRPAQNCLTRYGASIDIYRVRSFIPYAEEYMFSITPNSYKYNLGIHTINFKSNLCVVDGYGYYSPIFGRMLNFVSIVKTLCKRLCKK